MGMSKIYRMLGLIEGVCALLPDKPAEIVEGAVNDIECELEGMGARPTSRNDSVCHENACTDGGAISNAEQMELIRRLKGYLRKCAPGKDYDMWLMAEDCCRAASLIEELRSQVECLHFSAYAERL